MKDKHQKRTETRDIGKLSMRAAFSPGSIDEENRTVDIVWTTGARVLRDSWDPYYEDLSLDPKHVRMDRLLSGAPLLDAHNSWDNSNVIGVVESAVLSSTEGTATVRFAKDDEVADAIWRKVKDGILRNVSVGYRVHRLELVEEELDKTPIYRATDWEPMEISMVPIGADAGAVVRNEADATNPCEIIGLAKEQRMSKKDKPVVTETVVTETAPSAESIRAEGVKTERARIATIHRTASSLGLSEEFASKHINSGTDESAFRAAAFDEYEARKPSVVSDKETPATVVAGEDQRDKKLRGLGNWLITRSALADTVSKAEKARGKSGDMDPGEFRGMTLMDIARMSLEDAGQQARGLSKVDLAGKALTYRSGMATTSDFPILLENALHRVLLAQYALTEDSWSRFCATGSVSDFRAHNRYRLGSFGSLDTVAEHGEFRNKSIPDARKESITATTKGNIIALSRPAIISDDMGAFSRLAVMFGRAARLSIESDVYALLALAAGLGPVMADGKTLFHADHNNISSGAALAVSSIEDDRVVLGSQLDDSGNEFLDLRPQSLVLPIGLGGQARVINMAQYDVDAAAVVSQTPNKVQGLFADIVDTARLSGTRRYLFADPSIAPTIEVAFLDGQQNPYLETKEGWRIDGVEWKVRLDYAVGAIDYKGAVTDAGA